MSVAERHARMRPVSTGLPCPLSSKFQGHASRHAEGGALALIHKERCVLPMLEHSLVARTPVPLPRRLLRGVHHTPQQLAADARARPPCFGTCLPCPPSPNFQSRLEQTFTCWEPGARGPPAATRLLLCGAHHAPQQPVAEACALVPLFLRIMFLRVMLLQTIFSPPHAADSGRQ
jgi:hypothetical protein